MEFWLAEEFLERKEDETKLEKLLVRLALEVNRCQPGKLALEGERPANSQLDLSQIYRDFPSLPTEIWAKIISFLTWPERMKVERVCRTWRTASKASWSFQKKIEIDERFDSHKKVSALLERCGLHLEEIWTRQNLPQPYGGELLGQLCPNLKRLAFGKRGSFVHTEVSSKVTHENLIYQTDRLFTSFCQLERLEFYSKIETWMSTASNVVVLASG